MLRVEFHCHTLYSADSLVKPRDLVRTCKRKGIDRVVVTDHNQIEGALRAKEIDPERVIVGEEIMTEQGELLVAFLKEVVPAHLPPMETIERLRAQGAFISVSHPFDWRRSGAWNVDDLTAILPYVDAIETFNSRCLSEIPNRQAQEFAARFHVASTVGSDAHTAWELGRGNLLVPEFATPEDLKKVLWQAIPVTRLTGSWIHFTSTYARMVKGMRKAEEG